MVFKIVIVTSLLAVLNFGLVVSNSTGPPPNNATCANLMPANPAPHVLQSGTGTYALTIDIPASNDTQFLAYTAGTQYTGTLSADPGNNIRGFLITAVDPSGARIGTFVMGTGQKFLACSGVNSVPDAATLVHNAINTAATVSFTWMAPSGGDGMVSFRFTIVRQIDQYFGPLTSPSSSLTATTMPTNSARDEATTAGASGVSASIVLLSFIAIISTLLL